ncbi:Intradiol ring-cleavage dioxygenase [Bipolaris maydis]|nr:Intradiol ring-cleavage dioxygenase [Bipolaris maydis]
MFNLKVLTATFAVTSVFSGVNTHPGEKHSAAHAKREIERYSSAHTHVTRAFSKIHEFPYVAALKERAIARRLRTWNALREKRGIVSKRSFEKRTLEDLERYLNMSHDETQLGYTLNTPLEVIFRKNATAALVPEAIIGSYFASGELMRQDVTENLAGVPMHLDIQFLNINTMKPVKDLYVDIWHCNALGVYSDDSTEGQAGLNTTWLRGLQVTSPEGVVEFDTIVPGHYGGRAHHIHVFTTINSTTLPNHTYIAGVTNHIGQLFLEQSLLDEVEIQCPTTRTHSH